MNSLDNVDFLLLEELKRDSKQKLSLLSKKLGIPLSVVHYRIKRLEKLGVIKNYTINTNWKKAGFHFQAFLLVDFDLEKVKDLDFVIGNLLKLREVEKVYVLSANEVLCHVVAENAEKFSDFLLEKLKSAGGGN